MNATFSPTLEAYYTQWYELATSCTTVQYVLLASLAAQELLSLYHLLLGKDDENWDWDNSEQSLAGADDGQSLMSELLTSAGRELTSPEVWDDLAARVSRSRSPLHFLLQVARSRLVERFTGLSLNALLARMRGGIPHRDVARRRAGKLVEKVRSRHIESISSSTSDDSEFQSVHSSSSSPPSSTEESKQ
jgi:hypothetical protein